MSDFTEHLVKQLRDHLEDTHHISVAERKRIEALGYGSRTGRAKHHWHGDKRDP